MPNTVISIKPWHSQHSTPCKYNRLVGSATRNIIPLTSPALSFFVVLLVIGWQLLNSSFCFSSFERIKERKWENTLREAFWEASWSCSLLRRLSSALREAFSSFRTSARCASSSHSAWSRKAKWSQGSIQIDKKKNWNYLYLLP